MSLKYALVGFAVGAVLAYMRVKSAPTAHTQQAKGFGG